MIDPNDTANAGLIRKTVLETLVTESKNSQRLFHVDDDVAQKIAAAVLNRLSAVAEKRKRAARCNIFKAVIDALSGAIVVDDVVDDNTRNHILGTIRAKENDIAEAVRKAIEDQPERAT
jgi:hypothetical protein